MSTSIKVDTSELRALAADMRAVPEWAVRHLVPVVERGAVNVKATMVADAEASVHFKAPLAGSISYDLHQTSFAGDGVIEAEIGPDKDRAGGAIGNIAYFGTSRGGGTVRDPQAAADAELPAFEKALADAAERFL